jgi:hypothetical protein
MLFSSSQKSSVMVFTSFQKQIAHLVGPFVYIKQAVPGKGSSHLGGQVIGYFLGAHNNMKQAFFVFPYNHFSLPSMSIRVIIKIDFPPFSVMVKWWIVAGALFQSGPLFIAFDNIKSPA